MPIVIETNLSIDNENQIRDHQSRIIEVDSWEDYVSEITNNRTVTRNSYLGNLHGTTIPKSAKVENIEWDEKHLSCDIFNYLGFKTKKLVYLVR